MKRVAGSHLLPALALLLGAFSLFAATPAGAQVPPVTNLVVTPGNENMRLHRDLDVTQKTAWFMAHCIRKARWHVWFISAVLI